MDVPKKYSASCQRKIDISINSLVLCAGMLFQEAAAVAQVLVETDRGYHKSLDRDEQDRKGDLLHVITTRWIEGLAPGLIAILFMIVLYNCNGRSSGVQDVQKEATCEMNDSTPRKQDSESELRRRHGGRIKSADPAIVVDNRLLRFRSDEERAQFIHALPDIETRLQGFVNDMRYQSMRGVRGMFSGIDVVIEAVPEDQNESAQLKLRIDFIVARQSSDTKEDFEQCVKMANLPDAGRMFFQELSKRAAGVSSEKSE